MVPSGRVHTIYLEGDPHSLADVADKNVRERYANGIGPNFVVIPKSSGVTRNYFPTQPVALAYLRRLLELPPEVARPDQIQTAGLNPKGLLLGL